MSKLIPVLMAGEEFFISFSFDINDFIGDGIWWLQIYDHDEELIYDEPFTSSMEHKDIRLVKTVIQQEVLDP